MAQQLTAAPNADSPLLGGFAPFPIDLDRAEGCELIDRAGKRYVDLYGGHCVCLLGHNPPELREALNKQMERITFYSTALALPERDEAAQALLALAPDGFGKVFFVNSGAEANENALKFACAHTGRSAIVAIEGAFHGRTAGADCVTGDAARKPHYPRAPFDVRWVKFGDAAGMAAALQKGDVAAVILEPVQSTAGCRVQPKSVIEAINANAAKHGTLVIADEVQGGFTRCIENWSHQAVGLRADLMTCAKGLAAGFPAGALIARKSLGEPKGGLFGSTFGGGPLACAAIKAVCAAVNKPGFREHVRAIAAVFDECAKIKGVSEVMGIGMLRGIKLDRPSTPVRDALLKSGYLCGGAHDANIVRLLPPLTLSIAQARGFVGAIRNVLS